MKENAYTNMDKQAYRVAYLIAGYIRNTLTEKEHIELDDWVNASDHNMLLFEELTDEKHLEANLAWMDKSQTEQAFKQLQQAGAFDKPARRVGVRLVLMVAATVALLAALFFIFRYLNKNNNGGQPIATTVTSALQPGGNRATLRLADGAVIDLTSAENGLLNSGKGSHVKKPADGELVYEANVSEPGTAAIHTLSTPVGGQYRVRLPDGTNVWLNAMTTLSYPASFTGNERNVTIDGEAYFEVAKNEKQPFRVLLADSSAVTVLGTHFNVLSYKNESAREVSLLEGSVSVSKNGKVQQLEPGMQARIKNNEITRRTGIDTEAIIGWKDGLFVFHDAPLESIMQQVERWYDAKVVYQGEIKQLFNATILRSEPLSKLLYLLELTGKVHFKIENKTIYVLP